MAITHPNFTDAAESIDEDFISMTGQYDPQGQKVEQVTRPGVDGVALKKFGWKAQPTILHTMVDEVSAANAALAVELYADWKGVILDTLTDSTGQSYSDVAILDVQTRKPYYVETPVGGVNGGNWIVEADWTVLFTDVS